MYFNQLVSLIEELVPNINLTNADKYKNFENYGIDSIDVFNILIAVEERYHVKIEDEIAETIKTIHDIIILLEQKTPE